MNLNSKIKEIRKLIDKSKNPFLFFDADCDGTSSLFELRKKYPKLKSFAPLKKNEKALREVLNLVRTEHDLILFFDTPVLEDWFLNHLSDKKIVWVDHHLENSVELIKKYKIVHLNPLNYNKYDSRSASYWAYKISDTQENLFFCVLGTLADSYLLPEIIELYEKRPKEFNLLFSINFYYRRKLFKFIRENKFSSVSIENQRREWINYLWYKCNLILFKNYFELLYKEGYASEHLAHINKIIDFPITQFITSVKKGNMQYNETFNNLNKEYKKLIKDAIKKNKNNKLVYYEHSGRNSFNRQLSEELSYRCKKALVIMCVYKREGKPYYSISLRGKFFNVEKMLQETLTGLRGNGGGHKYACGVGIEKSDFLELKRRIEKYVLKK